MVSFFYKGHHDDEQYYIKCDWQNDLDYTIEQDTDLPICNFTLTTLKEFWSGTVTRKDLQSFLKKGREPDKLTDVVMAALQGDSEYLNNRLKWKVKTETVQECQVELIVYWDGNLPLLLGKFSIPKIANEKRDEYLKTWMEDTVTQSAKSKEVRQALLQRNKDLIEINSTLETRLDDIVSEKVDAEINLLLKMKKLVNSKKRRIRMLLKERQRAEEKAEEATKETTSDANDVKGKQPATRGVKDKGKGKEPAKASASKGQTTARGRKRKLDDADQAESQPQLQTQMHQTQPEPQSPNKRVRFTDGDGKDPIPQSQPTEQDTPTETKQNVPAAASTSSAPPIVNLDASDSDKENEEEEEEESDPDRELLERARRGRKAFALLRKMRNPPKPEPIRRIKPKEHPDDTSEEDSDATVE